MVGFAAGSMLMGWLSDRFGVLVPVLCGAILLGIGYTAATICQFLAAFARLRADRSRQLRGVRAADGRHLAVVHAPPRHRGGHRVVRQLPVGRAVVAADRALHRGQWLARHAHRHRPDLPRRHAAARACSRCGGAHRCRPAWVGRCNRRTGARHARPLPECLDGAVVRRGDRVLRRDGDAAGADRRLLRRSRLRRGARRRDALLDAGVRRREPHRVGMDRRSHRGLSRRCCSGRGLQGCGASPVRRVRQPRVALRDLRACSACFKAAWYRCTRSSCGNTSRPRRRVRAPASIIGISVVGMALGGWGSGAIFDLTGSYSAAFLHGFLWNVLNAAIVLWLLVRSGWGPARRLAPA